MRHMEKSDGLSPLSQGWDDPVDTNEPLSKREMKRLKNRAERDLKKEMKKAGKKGRESEFMWDPHNLKMTLIPTDDGDSHTFPHLDKMYDILHPGGNWPGTPKDKHDHDDHAAVTND